MEKILAGVVTDFKTKIEKVSISIFDHPLIPENWEVAESIDLKWSIELEAREWGVKDIDIFVPDQSFLVLIRNIETDEEKEITLEISGASVERYSESLSIVPDAIEFIRNEWTVKF